MYLEKAGLGMGEEKEREREGKNWRLKGREKGSRIKEGREKDRTEKRTGKGTRKVEGEEG